MKKLFTVLGLGLLSANYAHAQVWSQNFNSGIPGTWTMVSDGKTPDNGVGTTLAPRLAAAAWVTGAAAATPTDSFVISTSYFTPVGKADRWLITPAFNVTSANMVLSWEDFAIDANYPDSMQILISTTGATPASFTTVLYNKMGSTGAFAKHGVSLAAYNGQSVRIAFRENSNDEFILYMDNAAAEVLTNSLDASVDAVTFPKIVGASSSNSVMATITNHGASNINSLNITYKVDGGTAVTTTLNGLSISPFSSEVVTLTTPILNPAVGSHTITVEAVQVNGAADGNTTNNIKTGSFAVATQSTQRAGLIEEFSSSTCVPCAGFNATFDPLTLANNANNPTSNFNIVKYQMNWPSPGNDRSYNNDGVARQTYYGVNAIPDHYTNGAPGANGNQAEIDASKTALAYMKIDGTYIVRWDSVIANVTVTPYFTYTGGNFKLQMALTENHYNNPFATTTQSEYYNIMRAMLNAGAGVTVSSWTAGVPQTFTYKFKYTLGNPQQMNNNFWTHPAQGNLVVFVQDNDDQSILQSRSIPATSTGVATLPSSVADVKMYPNPATDKVSLSFNLKTSTKVTVLVTDAAGRTVSTTGGEQMNAGAQTLNLNVAQLAAGIYNVTFLTNEGSVTERLTVGK